MQAAPGTIRGDHALETKENIVHGSDSRKLLSEKSRSSFLTSFRAVRAWP